MRSSDNLGTWRRRTGRSASLPLEEKDGWRRLDGWRDRRAGGDGGECADRQALTRVASQVHGVFCLSRGGLWVRVRGGVAPPVHLQTQAVFGFSGQEVVPPTVAQHPPSGARRHSACPVIDVKHHLWATAQLSVNHTHTHTHSSPVH